MLYPGNYFGDYQILLDHTASETYSTFSKTHVYTHCMRAEFFLDLMQTFPDALAIFFPRSLKRRVEVRRIRKTYELCVGYEHGYEPDDVMKKANKKDIILREYSDNVLPKFLSDPDWFLKKKESRIIEQQLADESDSEKKHMFNMDDMEEQNTRHLQISIKNLSMHMDIINEYLKKIKKALDFSMHSGCNFLKDINARGEDKNPNNEFIMVKAPQMTPLNAVIFTIHEELENRLIPIE